MNFFSLLICIGAASAFSAVSCPPTNPQDDEAKADCDLFKCAQIGLETWSVNIGDDSGVLQQGMVNLTRTNGTDVKPLCYTFTLTPPIDGTVAGSVTVAIALIGKGVGAKPEANVGQNTAAVSNGVKVMPNQANLTAVIDRANEKFKTQVGEVWWSAAAEFYWSATNATAPFAITAKIDCSKSPCADYEKGGLTFAMFAKVGDDKCSTKLCSSKGAACKHCDGFNHCVDQNMFVCQGPTDNMSAASVVKVATSVALWTLAITLMTTAF